MLIYKLDIGEKAKIYVKSYYIYMQNDIYTKRMGGMGGI